MFDIKPIDMTLTDRFLEYVKFDTQSDELTNMTPSTPGQMIFAQHLEKELHKLGLTDISLDENGYLMATLPGNITDRKVPTVGFIAHLDTSPDMSGATYHHASSRIIPAATLYSTPQTILCCRPTSSPNCSTTWART